MPPRNPSTNRYVAVIRRLAGLPEDNCFAAPVEQHEGADKEL
jgi:hypothetical protein